MAFSKVQTATANVGSTSATSLAVATSATGSGNLLVASVYVQSTAGVTITPPTGWSQVGTTQGLSAGNGSYALFYLQNSTSGVTSFTFTFSASSNAVIAFEEWSGVATSGALDQYVVQKNAKATSCTTGTTAALAGTGELAIWGMCVGTGSAVTFSSITNSYVADTSSSVTSTEAVEGQTALFYNTNVGSAATSSGCTLSSTGSTGNTTILAVFKPASGGATPALSTSPTSLTFSATAGGSNPATQNDTLSETAGAATAWTSSIAYGSGSGWLGISPSSGSLVANGTQTVVYTCSTGALAAGTYTATVTYTATTGGATATVSVTFTVLTPANASTSPTSLSFSATAGGSNPASQNDTLSNTGQTSSSFSASTTYGSGSGWLATGITSGTLAGGANVVIGYTCTTGALAAGTYTATVTWTMGTTTATVTVTFTVSASAASASTSPTSLTFSAVVGGSNPASQNDTLSNTGGASSSWSSSTTYGSGSGWLAVSLASGTLAGGANSTISYTCSTSGLTAGTYTATVTYTMGTTTATVTVTFVVSNVGTGLYTIPTNTSNTVVQAADINQLVNVLQQPSGGQEKGHYILAEPCYASGATASWYIATLSRNSTPVSVSVDATDQAQSGYTTTIPNVDTVKAAGFHLYAFAVTSAQPNPIVGGVYTVQY